MATESRLKRLQYRHATFLKSTSNLEALLSACLQKCGLVSQRQDALDGQTFRLINGHARRLEMEFGDFIDYEAGANKLLVSVDMNVPALDVRQIAPPQSEPGKRTEFLESILYYGVLDNHVVLLQSNPWQSRHFEAYLNWILGNAGLLTEGDRVELSDTPRKEIREAAEKKNVKTIKFNAPVMDLAEQVSEGRPRGKKKRVFVPEAKMGAEIIKALLGPNEFERLELDKAAGGNLRVDLSITFERTTTGGGQSVLNSLASAFRHSQFEANDFEIVVPGVGRIRGDELKLMEAVHVDTLNGHVVADDLFQKMHGWLKSLIERNLVEHD